MAEMKESKQSIVCICGHCNKEKIIDFLGTIESFFCEYCKKIVTNFNTRPVMIPLHEKECNEFTDGIESW